MHALNAKVCNTVTDGVIELDKYEAGTTQNGRITSLYRLNVSIFCSYFIFVKLLTFQKRHCWVVGEGAPIFLKESKQ